MKAAFIREVGPPDHLISGEVPTPSPATNQVLIRVGAVAVNPIDTYIRAGANYFTLPFPYIVGCDLAGTVVELGAGVTAFSVGDRVAREPLLNMQRSMGSGFSEHHTM